MIRPLPNKIAFLMSPRLGDTLLFMVIANNLHRNGYNIRIFSDCLDNLRDWFPDLDIQPYPEIHQICESLATYDLVLHTFANPECEWLLALKSKPNVWRIDEEPLFFNRELSLVDLQVIACKELLGLKKIVRDNGLVVPPGLRFRHQSRRVVIHPTASMTTKYWLPKRFIQLAKNLQQKGFEPVFVVAPFEKDQVAWVSQHHFPLYTPHSLVDLANWLYESGWFIGNDSGIGHLASNLGVPTLSLMIRSSIRQYWRPAFNVGEVLAPRIPLIFAVLKQKYWAYLISVRRVLKTFERMNKLYAPIK